MTIGMSMSDLVSLNIVLARWKWMEKNIQIWITVRGGLHRPWRCLPAPATPPTPCPGQAGCAVWPGTSWCRGTSSAASGAPGPLSRRCRPGRGVRCLVMTTQLNWNPFSACQSVVLGKFEDLVCQQKRVMHEKKTSTRLNTKNQKRFISIKNWDSNGLSTC